MGASSSRVDTSAVPADHCAGLVFLGFCLLAAETSNASVEACTGVCSKTEPNVNTPASAGLGACVCRYRVRVIHLREDQSPKSYGA
jgi:hypothetical protein